MVIKLIFACIFVACTVLFVVANHVKVGDLTNKESHGIAGSVYTTDTDDETIVIKEFEYDGKCPDAFFMAGVENLPSSSDSALQKALFGFGKTEFQIILWPH